ncbi:hypothetical protein BHE74_00005084 [Ensete ventricosum]|uniref:Uncharacterized protein n=1 Tax=Ensete ventricosum TaxID=4639 RepID=A0A426YHY0_ENSVE|nr:hypothetical protein B296_00051169 [Ensete ventricosum]RWW86154.1 hypothetical protein BHE74_00005084 [Ensete ventricosum]RZR70476.1 hypothetical protein BHM03_00000085 [Ensete ventricosum]
MKRWLVPCRVDSRFNELDLELNLALRHAEEAEAQVEEAHDEAAIAKEMASESIMKSERKVKTLYGELKDAR